LPTGEILGVLPEREARAVELARRGALPAAAGLVPGLPADQIERRGGPRNHVEGPVHSVAFGQRSATTVAIHAAASALTLQVDIHSR